MKKYQILYIKKEKALVIYNEVIWTVSRDSKSYIAADASWKDALTGKPKEFKRNLGYLPCGYKVATLDPGDYTLQKLHYPYLSYMYTFTANGAVSFSVQGGDIVYLGELVIYYDYRKGKWKEKHYELSVKDDFDKCITTNNDVLHKGYAKAEKRLFTIKHSKIVIEDF